MAAGFTFFLSSNNTSPIDSKSLLSSDFDSSDESQMGSLLTFENAENASGMDAFGGKDIFGSPDFSNMSAEMMSGASNAETVGSVAYSSAETIGSVASCDCGGASVSLGGDSGGFSGGGFIG